jgi:hypothetical protein
MLPLSLKFLPIALALCANLVGAAQAATYRCQTTDGVYRVPGSTKLAPAARRDPKVIGSVFTVERSAGRVTGSSLFETEGKRVDRVQDTEDAYELLWHNDHKDTVSLRLTKLQGAWSFSYYSGWLGLMLAGSCDET